MNKFYLIDKPLGISSFDIIRQLRKKLNTRKIWHTWTLDPLATWGVILAVGGYTKLIPYLEKDKKFYEFTIFLDWVTDSFDLAEEVKFLSEDLQKKYKKEITKKIIENILKERFTWKISQIPPKYSALKIDWKRAYDLARAGKDVKMKSRDVEILSIEILDFNYPELSLKAEVSAWTYVRSIAADLWNILGTGWYIKKLRRTKISNLDIVKAKTLDSFDESKALEEKELFSNKTFITLDKEVLERINNWLNTRGNFNYPINEDLFVTNWWWITNIVFYDWLNLIPKRKI
jgi:tRNA pseudouridine55 synthase